MCGIAGIINQRTQIVSGAINAMVSQLQHRGPDSQDVFINSNVQLGHTRLSIIDLSKHANQPMQSKDGRYVLVYNGEIYNYKELQKKLIAKGYVFQSNSDTEVVLNSLIEWSLDALNYFNGMFAFGLWDNTQKKLTLARDRYGIKPLYYIYQNGELCFASEVKAILAHTNNKQLNISGLVEYLTFQNFFTDNTLFKNVRMLEPGCVLEILQNNEETPNIQRYWDFHFSEKHNNYTHAEIQQQLDEKIQKAVNRNLQADVKLGCYLSGGMDSGTITSIAAKSIEHLTSFTIGFDTRSASGLELAYDEREKAEYISYLAQTEHYEMVLKAGDMERAMQKIVWHLEEPRVGQSYPNYYASSLASKFVKVVLAGTGGDEIFAGYPWRYYRACHHTNFNDYIDQYYQYWHRLLPNKDLHQLLAPCWQDAGPVWTKDIFKNVFASHANELNTPEDYINHSMYLEAKTFLHGLLVVEDKLSMAHSLETRVPFLDNELVDFALQLPIKYKLGNVKKVVKLNENEPGHKTQKYFQKTQDGKLILRKVMSRYIPDTITKGVKQGFSAPDATWFKGESIEYVKAKLFNNSARIYDYVDKPFCIKLINEHLTGQTNRRLLIWSLLYLEEFLQIYN